MGFIVPQDAKIEEWAKAREATRSSRESVRRSEDTHLPELSELQVLRHFNRLSQMNFSVETGMYPLGSCTMKYNPKVSEAIASSPRMREAHPLQHDSTVQGLLQVFYELSEMLCEITGMKRFALSTGGGRAGGVRRRPHDEEVPARQGQGRQDRDTGRRLRPRDQPGERGHGGVRGGQGALERERPGHHRVGEGEAHPEDRRDDAHGPQHARALRARRRPRSRRPSTTPEG